MTIKKFRIGMEMRIEMECYMDKLDNAGSQSHWPWFLEIVVTLIFLKKFISVNLQHGAQKCDNV